MYERLFSLQADIFKVLANPKRLEIIQLLRNRELSVSDMISMLGIRQSNLSQHLSVLRSAGVVETHKQGSVVYYRLTDQRLSEASELIRSLLQDQHRFDPEIAKLLRRSQKALYPIVKDPVCGMRLSLSEVGASADHGDEHYYFCASGCKERFLKKPGKYLPKVKASEGR